MGGDYNNQYHEKLPAEAGEDGDGPFEPNDEWLRAAEPELQTEAMRRWFLARYEDPANATPYSEGRYWFMHGGPHDPSDLLQERFSGVVDHEVVEDLVKELWLDVGDEWAPIDHEDRYYTEALSIGPLRRDDPYQILVGKLDRTEKLVANHGQADPEDADLVIQLAFGAVIAAMETYLWDTTSYWAMEDDATLRHLVATNHDFEKRQLKLSGIFARIDGIKEEVNKYLQDLMWHRLDKIKPMMEQGLNIALQPIDDLMRHVLVRHDIIHRGGRTKDGEAVIVQAVDVRTAAQGVREFAHAMEQELKRRYPPPK